MSARGVPWSWEGSGDTEGPGVGRGGGSSGMTDSRPLACAALLRFRGEGFLVGDEGSCETLVSGSNSCEGSMLSRAAALPRVLRRGVEGSVFVVVRRDCRRGLVLGAGVKSSSLSGSTFGVSSTSPASSSEDSTTTFRRDAARRVGLVGDIVAILEYCVRSLGGLGIRLFVLSLVRLMAGKTRRADSGSGYQQTLRKPVSRGFIQQ